jgi:DNA-3-methyladenine glycosylase II
MSLTEIAMRPLAPFNFDLTAQIFSDGDKQIRVYTNVGFHQLLRINEKLVLVNLISTGTIEKPKLSIKLGSTKALTSQDKLKAEETVGFIFNLNLDLNSFYTEVENDQTLQRITRQLCGLKNPTTPTVFEALVDSVVEQQISIKVAHRIEERITKKFGDATILEGETYYAYPTPQNIMLASISEIQSCGLSQRKAEYIHNLAELIVDQKLDLEHLKSKQNGEDIISALGKIRGIGVWTAELTMLRGMQKLDVLPADDFGIRRVISKYYRGGKTIKSDEARKIAEHWGRWKGLAAFYLIIAEIRDIIA